MKVLDHGKIEIVESWGSDERVVEAARMSTGKGFLGWGPLHEDLCPVVPCDCPGKPGDEKLLKFLWDNKHATPFEMAGAVVEVEAPIFVFREWHRHRTQSYSEMRARYTPLPEVNYIPSTERLMLNSKTNKQAGTVKGAEKLTVEHAQRFQDQLADVYAHDQRMYENALKWGVPKELARVHLPVGRYSRMRASANLRNWLGFLTLRMAPGAQWEIRQYADALHDILALVFPRTLALFEVPK